jgi:hypothetical protein
MLPRHRTVRTSAIGVQAYFTRRARAAAIAASPALSQPGGRSRAILLRSEPGPTGQTGLRVTGP